MLLKIQPVSRKMPLSRYPLQRLLLHKWCWPITLSLPRHGRFLYLKETLKFSQHCVLHGHLKWEVNFWDFVNIPIFPINLLKFCQYPSFWLLTLSGPAGHNIDLTSEFLLGTKIAHVWEEKELLIISNCGILVPVRCS